MNARPAPIGLVLLLIAALGACGDDDDVFLCGNGECVCGPGERCEIGCAEPPCHIDCRGGNALCAGECANGSCVCGPESTCDFACHSPPCHVHCEGDHPLCAGECQNGSCRCGPRSECHFRCLDHNCHAGCAAGSQCVLECPQGRAGEGGCDFDDCAAGTPTVCPGGNFVTCGAPCPTADAGMRR